MNTSTTGGTNTAKIEELLDRITARITSLTIALGETTLSAELGNASAADELEGLASELKVASERKAALLAAKAAAVELDYKAANTAALALREQRTNEVGELIRAIAGASRKADVAIKDFARHAAEIVELRRLLSSYTDIHHQSHLQLDPGWSFGAAIAATGRLIVERCDLTPVVYMTFTEQNEPLCKQFLTPRNDPAKTAKGA